MRRMTIAVAGACLFFLGSGTLAAAKDKAKKSRDVAKELERGCDAGYLEDCVDFGVMFRSDAERDSVPKDPARAVSLFQKACDGEYARGCWWLGNHYLRGFGVPTDYALAASLYEQACNLGDFSGCYDLAQKIHHPIDGALKDEARWAMYMEKSCDRGLFHGDSCLKLGAAYDLGLWVPKDTDYATELFKKGCFFDNEKACDLIER